MKLLLGLAFATLLMMNSCGTAEYVYDDVYDAAAYIPKVEDGYVDLIKDHEEDHPIVVDKRKDVGFGGYYSNQLSGSGSFSEDHCFCSCNSNAVLPSWAYLQPGWIAPYRFNWMNFCSCHAHANYYNPYMNFAVVYGQNGYYNEWGMWQPYSFWGQPTNWYGYNGFNYGWNSFGNSNNGGWFNGNSGGDSQSGGNTFYGHRTTTNTGSSNTTSYEHTVKGVASNQNEGLYSTINESFVTVAPVPNASGTLTTTSGSHYGVTQGNGTPKPLTSSNHTIASGSGIPALKEEVTGSVSDDRIKPTGNLIHSTDHVTATNPFETKNQRTTSTVVFSNDHTTQNTTTNSETTTSYGKYTSPVTTYQNTNSGSNSSSRTEERTYQTNYNSNYNSGNNQVNTGHRNTTSSTNSGGSSSNSGGSRSTGTSRR